MIFIFIVQQYVSDKNVGSPIKYYRNTYIRSPYLTKFPSIPLKMRISFSTLQTLFHRQVSDTLAPCYFKGEKGEMRLSYQNEFKESTAGKKENNLDFTHFSTSGCWFNDFNLLCDTACFQTVTRIIFVKDCIETNIHVLKKCQ